MHIQSILAAAGTISLAFAAPGKLKKRASKFKYVGVNESGPEFGTDKYPGIYNTDYTWPTLSTYDTFLAAGMNTFRINFAMERMIPNQLTGSLDPNYFGNLTQQVNYITSRGGYAMIQPHNYGRYYDNIITDTAGFQAFWKTLAAPFASNPNVIFDTNNEYNTMPGALVVELNQAAINGIRSAGATTQVINVEGNAWTGAWSWLNATGTDGLTNAQTMANLTDPSNNLVYQMHQYLDSDGSGTSATCVSSTIGSQRLVDATNWLRENGKVGIIGEFAGGVNAQCEAAVTDMLNYMGQNTDVWQGYLWWAAGPWWANYIYSIEPSTGVAYQPYIPILQAANQGSGSAPTSKSSAAPTSTAAPTTGKPTTTVVTTKSPTTTATTTKAASPTSKPCAQKYAQCGGNGWAGATCCVSGSTCKVSNAYYSQCL